MFVEDIKEMQTFAVHFTDVDRNDVDGKMWIKVNVLAANAWQEQICESNGEAFLYIVKMLGRHFNIF